MLHPACVNFRLLIRTPLDLFEPRLNLLRGDHVRIMFWQVDEDLELLKAQWAKPPPKPAGCFSSDDEEEDDFIRWPSRVVSRHPAPTLLACSRQRAYPLTMFNQRSSSCLSRSRRN